MTTKRIITDNKVWKDLVDELGLSIGKEYDVQNISPNVALLSECESAPVSDDFAAFDIMPKGHQKVSPESGLGLWIKGRLGTIEVTVCENPKLL
jgi:hypothetical protein